MERMDRQGVAGRRQRTPGTVGRRQRAPGMIGGRQGVLYNGKGAKGSRYGRKAEGSRYPW
jgi:hypothetical protein